MSGHVVLWSCLCSDAADHPTWLPETCPGHDRPRTGEPLANLRPGGIATGHRCGEAICLSPVDPSTNPTPKERAS